LRQNRKYSLFATLNLPNTGEKYRAFSQTRVEVEKTLLRTVDQRDIVPQAGNIRRGIPKRGKSLSEKLQLRMICREIVETEFAGRSNLKCSKEWYKVKGLKLLFI